MADERATLQTGLRSPSALTVRRCQRLLASAEGQTTTLIARHLRGPDQTGRNSMHAFHQRGRAVLPPRSSRPHSTAPIFEAGTCAALRALLPQRPRPFGQPTRRWTLALAAAVSFAQGLTPRPVSADTIRLALRRLGVTWKRAQHGLSSPDPASARKQTTVVKRTQRMECEESRGVRGGLMRDGLRRENRPRPPEHPTGPPCKPAGGRLSCSAGGSCLPACLEGARPQAAVAQAPGPAAERGASWSGRRAYDVDTASRGLPSAAGRGAGRAW